MIHDTDVKDDVQADLIDKGHEKRGYDEGFYGTHICYHFMIGKDGTVKQIRTLSERVYCTRNTEINRQAIQIVVAGDLDNEPPTAQALEALRLLVDRLDQMYHFEHIVMHRDASPTACPGKFMVEALQKLGILRENKLGEIWSISRYYSPVAGQTKYYSGDYLKDVKVNCGLNPDGTPSDCLHTADGTDISKAAPFTIAACPPELPFGTRLQIEGIGIVTCHDRGGAIKKKRIDVWAGIGMDGLANIADPKNPAGYLNVIRL